MKTIHLLGIFFLTLNQMGIGAERNITTKWRYNRADNLKLKVGSETVRIPSVNAPQMIVTDLRIAKTVFLVKLATTLKSWLREYETDCQVGESPLRDLIPTPIIGYPSESPSQCFRLRQEKGHLLMEAIATMNQQALANRLIREDSKIMETLDLSRNLARNMIEGKWYEEPAFRIGILTNFDVGGDLSVVGGGAQNFGFFRKTVTDGFVPKLQTLTIEGFLNEFDLGLSKRSCRRLICVQPAVAVFPDTNKMYVQIGMNSVVSKENFRREPLNLSLVIDVSGSMEDRDGTEKSRLEWAKEAAIKTISELNYGDYLSIVTFDTASEIVIHPQRVTNKKSLIEVVRTLKTKGSTNLEAGLRDGYEQVSSRVVETRGYEQRVILVTDAGWNTGVTDEALLLKLVTDFANDGIGLTALGVGSNFDQKLIHGITQSRGGNYLFVQSGRDLLSYFDAFDFLVTPIAHTFKVGIELKNIDAKLEGIYGVPTNHEPPITWPLIDVQTHFFSANRGGAILAEYSLH